MGRISAYAISNIGNVRENHEDNLFVPPKFYIDIKSQPKIKDSNSIIEFEYTGDDGIFAICDGMGGHNAGEVASRIAVETLYSEYFNLLTNDYNVLLNFIKNLNNKICNFSDQNKDCYNMGTTFSSLIINKDGVMILHVGDSRIYKFYDNKLIQITKDHTEGCRLLEAGILKVEDLQRFPNRKSLYKYLGREGDLVADCENVDDYQKSRFIIASDGLSDTLEETEISKTILESNLPKEACYNLLNKCLNKGNKCNDNVTIICIDLM